MGNILIIFVIIISGILFMWLVLLRLISKLHTAEPCPASFSWIVDNPIRGWYTRSIFNRIGIQQGECVLELGPGPGAFTLKASKYAGQEGKIIAVDIQPKMIEKLNKRIQKAGVTNVETHIADAYNLPLDNNSIDRIFLITVLQEIPDKERALREMHRVLRSGCKLSVSEEFLDPDYSLARTTIKLITSVGFEPSERYGNWFFYTLNFKKLQTYSIRETS